MSTTDQPTASDQNHAQAHHSDRTIGQLVADATQDVQGIVHSEIALAKAEITHGAKSLGKGAGLLGAAGFFGVLAVVIVLHMVAHVLDLWLPLWAGYGIVALVLFIIVAILAALGQKALKKGKDDVVPKRAIAEAEQNIAVLKS